MVSSINTSCPYNTCYIQPTIQHTIQTYNNNFIFLRFCDTRKPQRYIDKDNAATVLNEMMWTTLRGVACVIKIQPQCVNKAVYDSFFGKCCTSREKHIVVLLKSNRHFCIASFTYNFCLHKLNILQSSVKVVKHY